jgi:hypothetical protein
VAFDADYIPLDNDTDLGRDRHPQQRNHSLGTGEQEHNQEAVEAPSDCRS